MSHSFNSPADFRIEVSGWGQDNKFFVEKADLLWAPDGEKSVQLHRALPEGVIVFVRLLAAEPSSGTVPVAYRVEGVTPMDCSGRCQMRLTQLRPRSKESFVGKNASYCLEDSQRECDVRGFEGKFRHEEILQ